MELVVMVGLQGAGKTTWVREHLAATHAVVSKDHWPNARQREVRQQRVVGELLAAGRDAAVDNTTRRPPTERPWSHWPARTGPASARCSSIPRPTSVPRAMDARNGRDRVPLAGVFATRARLVPPSIKEGFDRVEVIRPTLENRGDQGWNVAQGDHRTTFRP